MSAPLIEVESATFAYPGQGASLVDVSFNVFAGERIAVLGANGSGKSTLLHLLDGLFFAERGAIRFAGAAIDAQSVEHPPLGRNFRQQVGFLFQNSDAQLFGATVHDELAFGPLQLGITPEEIGKRIADTLALLDIEDLRARVPQRLSAGEKKTVALASLLTMGPRVLLLDEPTAGLDPRSQSRLVDILMELNQAGVTLITATHDLSLAEHVADRAIVLDESHRLAADGPIGSIVNDLSLLQSVNLVHVHAHRHGGSQHSHAHIHVTPHGHERGPGGIE